MLRPGSPGQFALLLHASWAFHTRPNLPLGLCARALQVKVLVCPFTACVKATKFISPWKPGVVDTCSTPSTTPALGARPTLGVRAASVSAREALLVALEKSLKYSACVQVALAEAPVEGAREFGQGRAHTRGASFQVSPLHWLEGAPLTAMYPRRQAWEHVERSTAASPGEEEHCVPGTWSAFTALRRGQALRENTFTSSTVTGKPGAVTMVT